MGLKDLAEKLPAEHTPELLAKLVPRMTTNDPRLDAAHEAAFLAPAIKTPPFRADGSRFASTVEAEAAGWTWDEESERWNVPQAERERAQQLHRFHKWLTPEQVNTMSTEELLMTMSELGLSHTGFEERQSV